MSRFILGRLAFVALIAVIGLSAAHATTGKRVALVIGIGNYRDPLLGNLAHPKGDADAMAQKLRELGFDVVEQTDPTKQRLLGALDVFVRDHRGADAVLVFFSGHGLQIGGQNFLLPTDATFDTAAALRQSALALHEIVARVAEVAPSRIILLDACRDDPTSWLPAGDPAVPIGSGLGRIGRADGTIYAFSTAPGATAEDGRGDHSSFAEALLAHLGDKGLEFGSVMKLVQMEVYDRTPTHQLPYVEDALPALFFAGSAGGPLPERDRLLLAMAKIDQDTRAQVERVAKTRDVPLAPLYGSLLAGAALTDNDGEARERLLEQAAEDFIKARAELGTLASSDREVTRLRLEAEHDLSLGALDEARSALTRAIEVDQGSVEALESRLKQRKLSEAASRAARAGVAQTHHDYRAAASDLAAAAELAARWDTSKLAWRYMLREANDLRALAGASVDTAPYAEAIETYGKALALAPRELHPLDWAATQDQFGTALRFLGEREGDAGRLEQAIAAFREALKERTRERVPLDWARTQTNLGLALSSLGERQRDAARFAEAVAAFHEALKEQTRERAPLDWARTQRSLGMVLWRTGKRWGDTAPLLQAVAAEREALKEFTRERTPLEWARTQKGLGRALMMLGVREKSTARLEAAIAAFQEALKEDTRARVPLEWANVQIDLANALVKLGTREAGTAHFKQAIAAFQEAAKEDSRMRVPRRWNIRISQSLVRIHLAQRTNDLTMAETAVQQITAALQALRAAGYPAEASDHEGRLSEARSIRDRLKAQGLTTELASTAAVTGAGAVPPPR